MEKRKLTNKERQALEAILKNKKRTWENRLTYELSILAGVFVGFSLFVMSEHETVINLTINLGIGVLLVFIVLNIIGEFFGRRDTKDIQNDLHKNKAYITTGPLYIDISSLRGKRYWKRYYVNKIIIDGLYFSEKRTSPYDQYEDGDMLRVTYSPHAHHIFSVKKVASKK